MTYAKMADKLDNINGINDEEEWFKASLELLEGYDIQTLEKLKRTYNNKRKNIISAVIAHKYFENMLNRKVN